MEKGEERKRKVKKGSQALPLKTMNRQAKVLSEQFNRSVHLSQEKSERGSAATFP